jgi:hypothetical protein
MRLSNEFSKIGILVLVSIAIRVFLFCNLNPQAIDYLSKRIENMSPVTSFIRLAEGQHLLNELEVDPYSSGFFKVNPITASLLFPLASNSTIYFTFLVACDLVTGLLLACGVGFLAGATFLVNPYTIISELGLSGESFDMFIVGLLVFTCSRKQNHKLGLFTLLVSFIAMNKPIIPFILIFPISLISGNKIKWTVILTFMWTVVLHVISFIITGGSWTYLKDVSKSLILQTPDLEPHMGFAWNLFTMSFPETNIFYRMVFYGHLFLIGVPIYWRFKKINNSERLARYFHIMVACMLLFQPYPTGINFSMIGSLLICCDDIFHNKVTRIMSVGLICGQLFTSAVGPLWLERNTGNANFLFYLDVVSTFIGIIGVGESLRVARIAMYTSRKKND